MFSKLGILLTVGIASLAAAGPASAAYNFFTPQITVASQATVSPAPAIGVNLPGAVTDVRVDLIGIEHTYPKDLDIVLESPEGSFAYVLSDGCGTDVVDGNLLFTDSAASPAPEDANCPSGTSYEPTNFGSADTWTTAAPSAFLSSFAGFDGEQARGLWKIHIADDGFLDFGSINTIRLKIDTDQDPPPGSTALVDDGITELSKEFRIPRAIADVDLVVNGIAHQFGDEVDIFLRSPSGLTTRILSDACGSASFNAATFTFDDEASISFPESSLTPACGAVSLNTKPTDHDPNSDSGVAATGSSLTLFDGQPGSGLWRLIFVDDSSGGDGYVNSFDLNVTMVPTKNVRSAKPNLKFKRVRRKINASGRVLLTGPAVTAAECTGSLTTKFQRRTTKRRKGKQVTIYRTISTTRSPLRFAKNRCGYTVSAKLPTSTAGEKLRLVSSYTTGDFLTGFSKSSTAKVRVR